MSEEIRQRVTIEADQAISLLRQLTEAQAALGRGVGAAGDSSQEAAAKTAKLNEELEQSRKTLADTINRHTEFAKAQDQTSAASAAASQKEQDRKQHLEAVRKELTAVVITERDYQAEIAKSSARNAEAEAASNQRKARIKELVEELESESRAQRLVNELVADEAKEQDKGSEAVKRNAEATKDGGSANEQMAETIQELVGSWLGFISIAGGIEKLLDAIVDRAEKGRKALADLGNELRGIAAIVGGKEADKIKEEIFDLTKQFDFDDEGKKQLTAGTRKLLQLQPGLTADQRSAEIRRLATIQSATGVGGEQSASLLTSMEQNLGLKPDEAANRMAILLRKAGFDPEELTQLTQQLRPKDGKEILNQTYAAHRTGLVGDVRRPMAGLLQKLTSRDEFGLPSIPLRELGATSNMGEKEVLQLLMDARRRDPKDGRVRAAVGTEKEEAILDDLIKAQDQGLIESAATELSDPAAAEKMIASANESESVRVANEEARNQSKLTTVTQEQGNTFFGKAYSDHIQRMKELGGGNGTGAYWLGILASAGGAQTKEEQDIQKARMWGDKKYLDFIRLREEGATFRDAFASAYGREPSNNESPRPVNPDEPQSAPTAQSPPPTVIHNTNITNVGPTHNYSVDPIRADSGRGER